MAALGVVHILRKPELEVRPKRLLMHVDRGHRCPTQHHCHCAKWQPLDWTLLQPQTSKLAIQNSVKPARAYHFTACHLLSRTSLAHSPSKTIPGGTEVSSQVKNQHRPVCFTLHITLPFQPAQPRLPRPPDASSPFRAV